MLLQTKWSRPQLHADLISRARLWQLLDDIAHRFFAGLMDYFQKVGEPSDPTAANQILGAPEISLDAWLQSKA